MPARKWLTPIFQSLLTTSFSLLQSKYLQSYFILPISPLGVPNFSLKLFFEFATKFSIFSFFPLSSLARDRSYFFFSAASGSILCSKEIAARKTRLPRSTIVPPWLSMNFHCRDFFRVLSTVRGPALKADRSLVVFHEIKPLPTDWTVVETRISAGLTLIVFDFLRIQPCLCLSYRACRNLFSDFRQTILKPKL